MIRIRRARFALFGAASAAVAAVAIGATQGEKPRYGYQDTPMLPGGKWHVHDGTRPQPPKVEPGTPGTQEQPGKAPSDAVVLFDGKDLGRWINDKGDAAGWKVEDGTLVVVPKAGSILTKQPFGDCQLHLEFQEPSPPRGSDQGRGNSGILFFGRYEIQVLDCVDNVTYADGTVGAIYGQHPPLVNAARPAGQWQTYDIIFSPPRFKADGSVESPAYSTVFLNGVLVQDHEPHFGPVAWRDLAKYQAHAPKGPILLQDHGDPVRFRNIWVRELKPRAGD